MKILIVCDYFEPVNVVGSIRPTQFAECFKTLGDEVDVVTFDSKEWKHNSSYFSNFQITRINIDENRYFKKYRAIKRIRKKNNSTSETPSFVRKQKQDNKFILYLKNLYQSYLAIVFGKAGSRALLEIIRQTNTKYDVVYTTYGGFASLLCGEKIKKKNPNIKWIVDLRDAIYYPRFNKTFVSYYKHFLERHCYLSDCLVFASKGYQIDSHINEKKYRGKLLVIENGFRDLIEPLNNNKKMTILYCGGLYKERHFYSIFDSLKKMDLECQGNLRLEIDFYGDEDSYCQFFQEASDFSVEKYLVYKGFVSKEVIINAQKNADALLISSWNYSDYRDVLPGKLFDYMAFQKPILGHVSGDLGNSSMKNIINSYKIGLCADDVEEGDYRRMYEYLKMQYRFFLQNGKCYYNSEFENELLLNFKRINQVIKLKENIKN